MERVLIVFITCAPNPQKNIDHWHRNFKNILGQNLSEFEVDYVISDCMSSNNHLTTINNILTEGKSTFPNRNFCSCQLKTPVGIQMSFNAGCKKMTEEYSPYDYYIFWQSDISFDDPNSLKFLIYQMGEDDAVICPGNSEDLPYAESWAQYQRYNINGGKVTLPVGNACNGLFFLISGYFAEKYKFKPWCDILRSNCSESFFSFSAAAIRKKWSVCQNIKVNAGRDAQDGPSLFARQNINNVCTIEHVYPFNEKYNIDQIIKNGQSFGLGFEEIKGAYMHNPDAYDNLFAKTQELYHYILDNLFVREEDYNYDDCNTIKFIKV